MAQAQDAGRDSRETVPRNAANRAPNILLIPGSSSVAHLRENLAVAELDLPKDAVAALDGIGAHAGSA